MKVNREKLDEAIRLRMEPASDHPDSWAADYCNALMDATGGVYNSLTVGLYGLMDAVRYLTGNEPEDYYSALEHFGVEVE